MPTCPRLLVSLRPDNPGSGTCVFYPSSGKGGGLSPFKNRECTPMSPLVLSGLPKGLPWAGFPVTTHKATSEQILKHLCYYCLLFHEEGSGSFLHEFFSCYSSSSHLPFAKKSDPFSTSFPAVAPVPAMPRKEVSSSVSAALKPLGQKQGFFQGFALSLSPVSCCLREKGVVEQQTQLLCGFTFVFSLCQWSREGGLSAILSLSSRSRGLLRLPSSWEEGASSPSCFLCSQGDKVTQHLCI